HSFAQRLEHPDHRRYRGMEPADFGVDIRVGDEAIGDVRHIETHDDRPAEPRARRDTNASKQPFIAHVSPNPRAPRATRPSTACCSSGPSARTVTLLPHSAASIITPMILLPFTDMPSLTTSISAVKPLASFTSWAAGRA